MSHNLLSNSEFPSNRPTEPVAQRAEPAAALPPAGPAAGRSEPDHATELLGQRLLPSGLAQAKRQVDSWLWYGYLGPGKITLLTSQWKSGKTTLLSILLARMAQGGQLAGLAVAAGRAAILSEEGRDDWEKRCTKLQLGDHVSLFCRPFANQPTLAQWRGVIDAMLKLKRQEGLDLVVIDPLSVFLPGINENTAGPMLRWLLPLRELTAGGLGVLLLHHPTKGVNQAGQAARGSGALASHVDILIEKSWFGKPDEADRRRWLRAYSRHEETRRHLLLELAAAGDDYLACDPPPDPTLAESWEVLRVVLEDASERLTQQQILEWWPEDFRKPDLATISRGLARGVEQGLICRNGTGRRNDPYRYWLPGLEVQLHPGPGATKEELECWQQYWQTKNLQRLLDFVSASPAGRSAASLIPAAPPPEAVVDAPVVAATQAAVEPCVSQPSPLVVERSPLVVERSPDRSTATEPWGGGGGGGPPPPPPPPSRGTVRRPCLNSGSPASPNRLWSSLVKGRPKIGRRRCLLAAQPRPSWRCRSRSGPHRHPSRFRRAWRHLLSCCPRLLYLRRKRRSEPLSWSANADGGEGGRKVEGHASWSGNERFHFRAQNRFRRNYRHLFL